MLDKVQESRRRSASDFHPEVLRLFDQYVHGAIDRRGFLDKSSRYAAMSGTTAAGLLAALAPAIATLWTCGDSPAPVLAALVEAAHQEGAVLHTITDPRERRRLVGLINDADSVGDTASIAALVEGFQSARGKGQKFSLVAASPQVQAVLKLARLDRVFPMVDSVAAARA